MNRQILMHGLLPAGAGVGARPVIAGHPSCGRPACAIPGLHDDRGLCSSCIIPAHSVVNPGAGRAASTLVRPSLRHERF